MGIRKKTRKPPLSPRGLSTLDDFLKDHGKLEEFEAVAIKEALAWQLDEAMKAGKIYRANGSPSAWKRAAARSAACLIPLTETSRSICPPLGPSATSSDVRFSAAAGGRADISGQPLNQHTA